MGNNKDRWSALSMQERADLIKLYTREGITDLKSIRKHYNGIPYRDLNTSEYDYFNASPDMVPTKEGEHWGSRNPHTGQILKREDHPTFDLATEGEDKAGYIIKRGIDGNLYSLPKRPDNYVEEVNNYSNGGNISWEDIDDFANKAEPWISGASLAATGASFIPGAQPVAVPAAVVLNGAGIALDTYQAARALSQKDYKDAIINGGEALLGMFGSKAASKIAKTAAGKYIGKIKEQMVNERLVNSGEKMVRLMRKGKTQEEAAEQVLKNAVNYVENSTKVKDITNTIYDKYINRGNTVSSVGDAIADGYDLIEGIDWNPLNEIKPAFISETKSYGGRILSGEEDEESTLSSKKPTLEEYLQHKADSTANAAYEKSRSRKEGVKIPYILTKEEREYNDHTIESLRENVDTLFVGPPRQQFHDVDNYQQGLYYQALQENQNNCDYGYNCIATATDNYPRESASHVNKDFYKNHKQKGFVLSSLEDIKKGDIVQAVYNEDNGKPNPYHALIFAGYDDSGEMLFNYSRGGITEWDYVHEGHYPFYNDYPFVYKYVGTPEVREKWTQEYNNKYPIQHLTGGKIRRFKDGGNKANTETLSALDNNLFNRSFLFDSSNTKSDIQNIEEPVSNLNKTYTVVKGDYLNKIANDNNVSIETLIASNPNIKNTNEISVGQEIIIPQQNIKQSEESKLGGYEVQAGDTLSKIASKNKMSLNQLMALNPQIKNINNISIGQKINLSNSAPKVEREKQWVKVDELRTKEAEYNKTNLGAIQGATHDSNYVVIDKKGKKLTVYNANNEVVYETSDISTGLSGNDYNTKTFTRNGKDVYGEGNMSTPAGVTRISSMDMYHGAPSFQRVRLDSYGNPKKVYNSKGEEIDDTINSSFHLGSIDKVYSSNGCVRMSKKALNDLGKYINVGTLVYTLPDKDESRFVLKDGNLSYEADNPYGITEKGKEKNKYGHDMVYQDDYNVFNNKTSSPIKIEYVGEADLSGKKKENVQRIIDGITSNKEVLQKAFNVSDFHFNKIAQLAMGILEQESKFGTSPRYLLKKGLKNTDVSSISSSYDGVIPDEETGITLFDVIKHVKGNNTYDSLGMSQIKLEGDNEETQKMYRKFGITPENVASDEKTAEALMVRLLSMYRNEIQGREFKNKETGHIVNPYDALLYKYKGGTAAKVLREGKATGKNEYVQNVKKYSKDFTFYTYK